MALCTVGRDGVRRYEIGSDGVSGCTRAFGGGFSQFGTWVLACGYH